MFRPRTDRVITMSTCVWLAAAVGTIAQPADRTAPPTAATDPDARTRAVLERTLVDVDFSRKDLAEIIEYLRDAHSLNVHVQWTLLEQAGVRRDSPLTIKLRQVSLETLLEHVLDTAGKGDVELAYEVRRGVVVVTTREDLARRTELRVYDLSDLLRTGYGTRRFANTPVLRLQLAGGEAVGGTPTETVGGVGGFGGGGGGNAGGGLFTGGQVDAKPEPAPIAADFDELERVIELIQNSVAPESWRTAGGNVGAIDRLNNSVYVTQTQDAHRELERLLDLIRTHRPARLDADAMIVRMSPEAAAAWRESVGPAFPRLSADQFRELARRDGVRRVFDGSTSGLNTERMWFSHVTQRFVVGGSIPVLGDAVWAASMQLVPVNEGLELIVTPALAPDGATMRLDVQMAWAPPAGVTERQVAIGPTAREPAAAPTGGAVQPAAGESGVVTGAVDLVTRRMRTVSTTAEVTNGQAVALSIPDEPDASPPRTDTDWLILHVRTPAR